MAFSFEVVQTEDYVPCNFEQEIEDKLHALDIIRSGNIVGAMEMLYLDVPKTMYLGDVDDFSGGTVPYKDDPEAWKEQMKKISAYLKEHGV